MHTSFVLSVSLAGALFLGGCKNSPATPSATTTHASEPTVSAARPPRPVDGALPDVAPHPLDRRDECARDVCTLAHLVPDEARPALSDGAPMVLWEQVISERSSVAFPRDEAVELDGVVLDGILDLTAMEAAPKSISVGGRWAGFRAPGGGVTLTGNGGKPVRVVLVVAVAHAGGALSAHIDQRDRPGAPPSWVWKTRPKPIQTVSFAGRPDLAWGNGAYHARIGWESNDRPAVVVDLLRMSADAATPEHDHQHEWESLALLEGDGTLLRRAGGAEQRVQMKAGAVATVPAGVKHAWKPSGEGDFFAIQVFAPPGPEQRYKKLAAKAP